MSTPRGPTGPTRPTGATRVAGLVGGPLQVARSLSPAIHNAAFAALGLDWVYVGFPVGAEDAPEALRGLGRSGIAGFNVTMPHKLAAAAAVDRLEGQAAAIGAVNTVVVRDGETVGWNTDGDGLVSFLQREAGLGIDGCAVLVVGSGGSARSVVAGLGRAGAASITVLARNAGRAEDLGTLAGAAAFRAVTLGSEVAGLVAASDLIVHTTPVGQEGEEPLIAVDAIRREAVVVDLIYPAETRLVQAAASRGARAYGGLGMLVHQAALAFEIFTGREAPLEAMWAGARGTA